MSGARLLLADSSGGNPAIGFLVVAAVIGAYWLPLIVAASRHVPHLGSVAVVNLFLGWTVVGWVVAMAMAVRSVSPPAGLREPPGPPRWPSPRGWTPPPAEPPGGGHDAG